MAGFHSTPHPTTDEPTDVGFFPTSPTPGTLTEPVHAAPAPLQPGPVTPSIDLNTGATLPAGALDTSFYPSNGTPTYLTGGFGGSLAESSEIIGRVIVENPVTQVSVSNFPGTVNIGNLPDVQQVNLVAPLTLAAGAKVGIEGLIGLAPNTAVHVSNLQPFPTSIEISNLPTFPSSVSVSNLQQFPTHLSVDGEVALAPGTRISIDNWPAAPAPVVFPSKLKIDDTSAVRVEVTNQPAPAPFPTSIAVSNLPEVQHVVVDNQIDVTIPPIEFPAVQAVSGTVSIANFPEPAPIEVNVPPVEFPETMTIDDSTPIKVEVVNQVGGGGGGTFDGNVTIQNESLDVTPAFEKTFALTETATPDYYTVIDRDGWQQIAIKGFDLTDYNIETVNGIPLYEIWGGAYTLMFDVSNDGVTWSNFNSFGIDPYQGGLDYTVFEAAEPYLTNRYIRMWVDRSQFYHPYPDTHTPEDYPFSDFPFYATFSVTLGKITKTRITDTVTVQASGGEFRVRLQGTGANGGWVEKGTDANPISVKTIGTQAVSGTVFLGASAAGIGTVKLDTTGTAAGSAAAPVFTQIAGTPSVKLDMTDGGGTLTAPLYTQFAGIPSVKVVDNVTIGNFPNVQTVHVDNPVTSVEVTNHPTSVQIEKGVAPIDVKVVGAPAVQKVEVTNQPVSQRVILDNPTTSVGIDGLVGLVGIDGENPVSDTNPLPVSQRGTVYVENATGPLAVNIQGASASNGALTVTFGGSPGQVYLVNPVTQHPYDVTSPLAVQMVSKVGSLSDHSGTIIQGGVSQALVDVNPIRQGMWIQNHSNEDLWVRDFNGAASPGPGCIRIPAKAMWDFPLGSCPPYNMSIYGATTGQAFTVRDW